jgi:arginyl-tRNA synthetase
MNPSTKIKKDIINLIKKRLGKKIAIEEKDIVIPPTPEMGDFSLTCFGLAKILKDSPQNIAAKLQKQIKPIGLIFAVENSGPYLNFRIHRKKSAELTLKQINKEKKKYGNSTIGRGKKIYIEYVSPNTNKPLHLGHLRNGFLGEAVSNIFETAGYKVIRGVLNNDRGMGISKSMLMYEKFGNGETPESAGLKSDHFVGKYYVMFEQKGKGNTEIEEELRQLLQKWEEGDKKTMELWKKMNQWAQKGYKETYKKLGIKFDKEYFESKIYKRGKEIVLENYKKGIFTRDENKNITAKLEGLPDRVLLRADGTAVYITTDLAYAEKVFKENKISKLIYVVGNEQDLSFKQLFQILKKLGHKFAVEHLSYGIVNLPEGRMKSREGTVVDADDLVTKLEDCAIEEIKTRHDFLKEKEVERRATPIALSALKYFILNVGPKNSMIFDPRASLSFTGNTGPYLLYTYARMANIFEKAKAPKTFKKINYEKLLGDNEHKIISGLARFGAVLKAAEENCDPSEVAKYLYELAKDFSDFYRDENVLKAEKETKMARLFFLRNLQVVFEKGLRLLGIEPLKNM